MTFLHDAEYRTESWQRRHSPEAIAETVRLAERCNVELTFGESHFPIFPVPEGDSLDSLFEKAALAGLEERLNDMREIDQLTPEIEKGLKEAIAEFKKTFVAE